MKKLLIILLGLLVISTTTKAEEKKPYNPRLDKIKTIAVLPAEINLIDCQDQDNKLVLSKSLTEKVKESLFNWRYDDYQIVERDNMEQILNELKFQLSGITNPEATKKLGQLLNVDGLFVTILTGDEKYAEITYKLIEVETGKIIWMITGRIAELEMDSTNKLSKPGFWYSKDLRGPEFTMNSDLVSGNEEIKRPSLKLPSQINQ